MARADAESNVAVVTGGSRGVGKGIAKFTWSKPFWEQPLWRWDAMFSAGVREHYRASQLAAPGMIARRRGLIVNISHWAAWSARKKSWNRLRGST